jgi:hypothetical protein
MQKTSQLLLPFAVATLLLVSTSVMALVKPASLGHADTCTTCTQTCTTVGNVTTCISNCRTSQCIGAGGGVAYPTVSRAQNGSTCTVKAPGGTTIRGTVTNQMCRLERPFKGGELSLPSVPH